MMKRMTTNRKLIKQILLIACYGCVTSAFAAQEQKIQGLLDHRPDVSTLQTYKVKMFDARELLGYPATTLTTKEGNLVYTYHYKTPQSILHMDLLQKGDYKNGCELCGTVVATFTLAKEPSVNYVLMGIALDDTDLQNTSKQICEYMLKHDFAKALPMIQNEADLHFSWAEHTLGLMYINGDGVDRNNQQASYWFSRAAGAAYPPALYDLGAMYKNGENGPANLRAAKMLYARSANLGYVLAMQELVKIYQSENDSVNANLWLEKQNSARPSVDKVKL